MSINLSQVKSASLAFKKKLPNGAYQCKIVEVKRNPLTLEVLFAVTSGPYSGETVRHWFAIGYDWGLAHLKRLCECISKTGKAPDVLEDEHLMHMEGKELIMRTILEKSSRGMWPKIADLLPDTKENFEEAQKEAEMGPEFVEKKEKTAPPPPAYSAADGEW